ncbi:MAG TPA: hypothetical protein VFY26_01905 [Anaerolineales bacterium]|nr:hypothetical protein [Anaerolineales bacterium]
MNSSTFARLALLLPYLPLLESILYFIFRDISEQDSFLQSFNLLWNFLAIFWYVPYTLLVIYLLIWSIRKTSDQIFKRYKFAPVILMFLAAGLYTILFLVGLVLGDDTELGGILMIFGIAAVVAVPASLILGYAFVGLSLLLYKLFLRRGWVKVDELPVVEGQIPGPALNA